MYIILNRKFMDKIESICGVYPNNFEKPDITSDPNYVFVNDPSYSARQLFDSEGSTVFVNSFIECAHYVDGGWDFTPIKNLEISLHNYLFIFVSVIICTRFILKKYKNFKYV